MTDAVAMEVVTATFEGAVYIGLPIGIVIGMWFMSWLRRADRGATQRERAQLHAMIAAQMRSVRRV